VVKINREELAWAAGFFDGEGHASGRKPRGLRLSVSQRDWQVLERFDKAVLGLGRRGKTVGGGHPMFVWRTTNFADGQAVIAMLWRFLSPIKRLQCKTALIEFHQKGNAGRGNWKRMEV
jgi:hypothetical protein